MPAIDRLVAPLSAYLAGERSFVIAFRDVEYVARRDAREILAEVMRDLRAVRSAHWIDSNAGLAVRRAPREHHHDVGGEG